MSIEENDGMPRTVAVTLEEGGEWWPFASGGHVGKVIHSIKFEDGRIWDAINGWRPSRLDHQQMIPEGTMDCG